ncbi:MAG: endonuclease/exonuclease/phosphatase family protein [Deltaproteobacteria bacterium]|jgi:endonuclease/exonuclease/phosphatase family metal-dependent hydrolase|nr:endonuclease/exonuclease/phosphatase family protein [Deltaproteobacteria bacterium]MBW2541388.1 endonuclease/exonuclease/phosphatase family protein [Deltaproteobacteria bacterium]
MKIECACFALSVALFATASVVSAAEPTAETAILATGTEISVLSYNVHGLFPLVAKDDPRDRMPTIGWLANRYDVAIFQEDFEYHDVIREQMTGAVGARGNGMGWDPRRVAVKLLISPVSIFLPHFSPPYGAGISIFVRESLAIPGDVDREPFNLCRGWFGSTGDCWAAKGFQRVGIRTPDGAEVDIYNTHLEAGASNYATEIRGQQLDLLARAIEARPKSRAVIVAGDFNTAFNRPGDRDTLVGFRRRLELRDSGAGPELSYWRERDYILHRDGTETALHVEQAGEAQEFVIRDRALSDHPAIYARFRITPLAAAERVEP